MLYSAVCTNWDWCLINYWTSRWRILQVSVTASSISGKSSLMLSLRDWRSSIWSRPSIPSLSYSRICYRLRYVFFQWCTSNSPLWWYLWPRRAVGSQLSEGCHTSASWDRCLLSGLMHCVLSFFIPARAYRGHAIYIDGKMLSVTKYGVHILLVYINTWSIESSSLRCCWSDWSYGGCTAAQIEPMSMPSFPPSHLYKAN